MRQHAFRFLIAIVLIFTSTPMMAMAQSATPQADAPVVEDGTTSGEVDETSGTVPVPPSNESTGTSQGGTAESPASTSGQSNRSLAPTTSLAPSLQEAGAGLTVVVEQCGNDDRIGEFDFFFGLDQPQALAADTSYDCVPLIPGVDVAVALIPADGGDPISPAMSGGPATYFTVPAGSYTVSVTIGDQTETSDITLDSDASYQMAVAHYIGEKEQPAPGLEGTGNVSIGYTICQDDSRAMTTSFLVLGAPVLTRAAAAPISCQEAEPGSTSFMLTNVDNKVEFGPSSYAGPMNSTFTDIPSGSYTLTDLNTGSVSEPFTVLALSGAQVSGIAYLPETKIDLFVEKIWCEDNDKAGTTEFTLDTPPTENRALAASSTCVNVPTYQMPEVTATLDLVGTDVSFRQSILTPTYFWSIPAGTYTVTESADGMDPVTSDPMAILETDKRIRIINYIAESEHPAPDPGGVGGLQGLLLFCQSPDHEQGDVDFIIRPESPRAQLRAVSTCDVATSIDSLLMLYPVDPDTNEPDLTAGIPVNGYGWFYAWDLPSGAYVLAYTSPTTGETELSDPFAIYDGGSAYAEVNVYSAPVSLGTIDVWKEFCVDAERVGDASFTVIRKDGSRPMPALQIAAASATVDCRSSNGDDAPISYTLTNIDTGRTWADLDPGSADGWFSGIPAGTYTLTEPRDEGDITSEPFTFDPARETIQIEVRNFIGAHDWEPEEDQAYADIHLRALICTNPERDGGSVFFIYGDPNDLTGGADSADGETSSCRPATEDDGLAFEAVLQDGESDPIPFIYNDDGEYRVDDGEIGLPSGQYIVRETTTGSTSGVFRANGWTWVDFLKYESLPRAEVTLTIRSEFPAIANALPAGATWTVSQNGVDLFSDTFADEHLQLAVTIPVTNPMPYGTYTISIDGTPDFLFYSGVVVVDEPTEAFEFALIPLEDARLTTVALNVTSADLDVADRLPDDATWTVTSVENPALVLTGTFSPEERDLPTSLTLPAQLPDGQYIVEVTASPAFAPYRETFAVGADTLVPLKQGFFALQQEPSTVWDILLQPVVTPETPSPSPSPAATPSPTETVTTEPATPAPTGTATPGSTPGTVVTTLPTTGQGTGDKSMGALLIPVGASALLAAIGGLAIRRRHA